MHEVVDRVRELAAGIFIQVDVVVGALLRDTEELCDLNQAEQRSGRHWLIFVLDGKVAHVDDSFTLPPPPELQLPEWVPEDLAAGFARYSSMGDQEREAFASDLARLDGSIGDPDRRRTLRIHAFSLFASTAAGDLAKVMSANEGREVVVGEAGVLIIAGIDEAARLTRFQVPTIAGVATAPNGQEWILGYGPRDAYGWVRGTRDNFLHLASGEKPRRFRKGWKKRR